jgi:protein-arginine kinase activator protein McsA
MTLLITPINPRSSSSALRLDTNKVETAKAKKGTCRECGAVYQAQRTTREFCSAACRRAFNNRKMIRGAAIYSLAMEWRADRSDTTALNLLCRLLAEFKNEDDWAGRKSWDSAANVIRDRPYLTATVLDRNITGLRRTGGRK